jgi:hypothetical protein
MRMNLITKLSSQVTYGVATVPLSLTIKPACGIPGDYQYATDSATLLKLLHKKTDLPAYALQRFEQELFRSSTAKLMGVELSERVLTDLGYFVD